MKIRPILLEMSAKKLCPDCGKSMAANHYWYKGGWKCKKAKDGEALPTAQVVMPATQPSQAKVKPTASNLSKDALQQLVPELGRELYRDDLYWHVGEYKGTLTVEWDYTFKRDTRTGAYQYNRVRIEAANARIRKIAQMFPDSVVNVHYCTPESVKASDNRAESNGESSYSEYEQSIGGGITLTSPS